MKDLGKALDSYCKLEDEIYEYFGYEQQWRVYPITDEREYFWRICGEIFNEELELSKDGKFGDDLCSVDIRGDALRKDDFTMIAVDTNTDGNVFCYILDNKKEREKPEE